MSQRDTDGRSEPDDPVAFVAQQLKKLDLRKSKNPRVAFVVRELRKLQKLGTTTPALPRSIKSPEATARIRDYLERRSETETQAAFAERAHIGPRTLGRLLQTGKATKSILLEVAHAMGVSLEDLLRPGD